MYYILLIGVVLAFLIRGYRDKHLGAAHDTLSHRLTFIRDVILVGIACYAAIGEVLSITFGLLLAHLGFVGMLVLNTTMNLLKGKDLYYLGGVSGIDLFLKKIEKSVFVLLTLLNIAGIVYFSSKGL